jgi:FkbM family methyltransferase
VLDGDTIISDQVERNGRLDFDPLLPHILPLIRPGDTVIDIGAFIGDHTAAYSLSVGESGKVIAFEPNPVAFHCLVHNVGKCGNVLTFNHALGSESKGCDLTGEFASAYLQEGASGVRVSVRPLSNFDSLFSRIDLIKIDVEGYELNVLKGAEKLVEKFHPHMVIEINPEALGRQGTTPEAVMNWVAGHGYSVSILYRHPDTPFYDILAEPVGATEEPAQSTSYVHDSVPPPQATAPETFVSRQSIATPKEEMMECIAFLKAYAEKSNTNKQVVAQRLFHAGLRPRSRKTNDKNNSVKAGGLRPDHSPKGRTKSPSKL